MMDRIYPDQIIREIGDDRRYKVVGVFMDKETRDLKVGYHGMLGDHQVEQYWIEDKDKFKERFEEVQGGLFG